MEASRCSTVLKLLAVAWVVEAAWSANVSVKAFRLALSNNDRSVVLCAVSEANQTLPVSELHSTQAGLKLPQQVVIRQQLTVQY